MTGDSALLFDDQQHRVVVAVEPDLAHPLHVAGLFALAPQLACASATSSAPRRVRRVRASASRFIHASVSTSPVARPARSPARVRRRSTAPSSSQSVMMRQANLSDARRRHRRLRLADRELAVVEDAGGEHRVGAAVRDAVDQVLQACRRRRTRSPERRPHRRPRASARGRTRSSRRRGPCWSAGSRRRRSSTTLRAHSTASSPVGVAAAVGVDLHASGADCFASIAATMHCEP